MVLISMACLIVSCLRMFNIKFSFINFSLKLNRLTHFAINIKIIIIKLWSCLQIFHKYNTFNSAKSSRYMILFRYLNTYS